MRRLSQRWVRNTLEVATLVATFVGSSAVALAQYTVTPLQPVVNSVDNGAVGAPFFTETHTATAGSLAIQVITNNNVTGSGTITAAAPASIDGTLDGQVLRLTPPGIFTFNAAITNARFVNFSEITVDGLSQFDGTTQSLTLSGIAYDPATLTATLVVRVAFRLPITPGSDFSTPEIRYSIAFNWRFTPVCKSTSSAQGSRKPSATGFCAINSISLDLAFPFPVDPLMAFSLFFPPFCGSGSYTYQGTNKAHIFLELVDQKGNIIGRSTQVKLTDFPAGSNQSWGAGCQDPKQLILITQQKAPILDYPENTPFDKVVGTVKLQASLYDSATSQQLATSAPIVYGIVPGVAVKTGLVLQGPTIPDASVDTTLSVEAIQAIDGKHDGTLLRALAYRTDFLEAEKYTDLMLAVGLDLAASKGMLDAEIIISDGNGVPLAGASQVDPKPVSKGHSLTGLRLDARLQPQASTIDIFPRVTLESGQILKLSPILLTVDSLAIAGATPDPKLCSITNPGNCPVKDQSNSFQINLALTPVTSGEQYTRLARVTDGSFSTPIIFNITKDPLPFAAPDPGKINFRDDIFDAPIPKGVTQVQVFYSRKDRTHVGAVLTYSDFTKPDLQIAANVANQNVDFVDGKLGGIISKGTKTVKNVEKVGTLVGLLNDYGKALKLDAPPIVAGQSAAFGAGPAAAANPAFLAIDNTWQFDPPIPHDGSFSANISLNYRTSQFPDDPNFAESKLQVISIDAAGAVHVYPTTLDTTNKVATAQIDGLDPYYSLAVIGPFSQTQVTMAATASGYVLVNTGTQDASVNVGAYSTEGVGTPATSVLKAGTARQATGGGLVQAWANPSTIAGVSWFDNGSLFAVTPAQAPGQLFVLTDVEYGVNKSTEIDLANSSPFGAEASIALFAADGTAVGTFPAGLGPKSSLSARIESLFPSIAPGFAGYAIVGSREAVTVSGLQLTNTTAAGLVAQPITESTVAATSKFVPQLGGPGVVTTLHVVNTGTAATNLTLKARTANGSAAGTTVNIRLAAGKQYSGAVGDIFGIDPASAGSVEVDSDTPGVFGDILTVDANFIPKYAVSLPLSGQPASSSVLPYATANTTVSVLNPNSSAATVTVTPLSKDGAKGSASSASIPAFGRAALTVNSSSYVAIGSSQPVVAAGWIVVPSGTTAGYPALASSAAAGGGSNGPAPQVNSGGVVNAASFTPKLVRGGLASIFGSNFVAGSATGQASILPLPLSLAGVSVSVGGVPAPLIFVSANQINFQVPFEVPAGSSAAIVVTTSGGASPAVFAQMADYGLGVFTYARTASAIDPIIVHGSTNQLVTPSNPAAPNEALVVYATGVGKLSNAPRSGVGAPSGPLAIAVDTPSVTVNSVPASVLFAGLTPGFIGLVQINIQLPGSLPSGSLPLAISFPGDASPVVNLAVQSSTSSSPKLTLSTNSLAFGNVTVNQTKDLSLLVSNSGSGALSISSVKVSGAGFTLLTASSATLTNGQSATVTVRFAPASAASFSGTLSIVSNDAASPAVVSLGGSGQAAASRDTVLQVDGGAFDSEVGFPNGTPTAYFVNRLTPPSYPATIKSVQVFFSTRSDGLTLNTPLTVVSATNPSGSATLSLASAGTIDLTPGKVSALDQFVTYAVPARTITSGDFVIGFMVANPANVYPAELDQLTKSQRRSYASSDGFNFFLLDTVSADVAGNLGIRAVVTVQ